VRREEIGKILSLRILGNPIDRLTGYLTIIMYNFIKYVVEGKEVKKLERVSLTYAQDSLGRSLSKQAMAYHYGKLYKAYVDRYNSGEGDPDFNEAGAFLHSIYFSQFRAPKGSNKPEGVILEFIEKHFKSWDKFQEEFEKTAMAIQGSGWVYLSRSGKIKTIKNHEIKNDIILLIDWWEHAWALDYQADKKGYLAGQWRIIDWPIINTRLTDKGD
jgi:Fe-Mn family superoxide dismutase